MVQTVIETVHWGPKTGLVHQVHSQLTSLRAQAHLSCAHWRRVMAPSLSRVAAPGSRVVAVCRAHTWPCPGLGRDTAAVSQTPSWSQYTVVYCDTIPPVVRLLMSRYNKLYHDLHSLPIQPPSLSQYNRCIATQSSPSQPALQNA